MCRVCVLACGRFVLYTCTFACMIMCCLQVCVVFGSRVWAVMSFTAKRLLI